jgi:hypothetical protein
MAPVEEALDLDQVGGIEQARVEGDRGAICPERCGQLDGADAATSADSTSQ